MLKEEKKILGNIIEKSSSYKKPEDIEELEKELKERGRLMAGWISKLVNSRMEDIEEVFKETKSVSKKEEDEKWDEQRTKKEIAKLQDKISILKDIERVMDPYIKKERSSQEKIEKYKKEALKLVEEISQKNKERSGIKELIEVFSEERLNQLKWFELEKLPSILEKVKNGELLNEKEAGFLRYCANFPFEEISKEKPQKSEDEYKEKLQKTEVMSEKKEEKLKYPEDLKSTETELKKSEFLQSTLESTENIEKKVISLEEAENNLNIKEQEYLRLYRERIMLQIQINREKDENVKLQLENKLRESKLILDNVKKLYNETLQEYKIALYFDLLNRKKESIFNIIKNQRENIITRIKKENPNISEDELNTLVNQEIQKEIEEIFNSQKQEIQKETIGSIAYNILQRREQLTQEEQNILRQENEKSAGFFGKLWNRYKGLSYGRKVLIGAGIAGLLSGGFAAAGGAGFAALGIGSTLFIRRFFGGFVVGGGIKAFADRIISHKEKHDLDKKTAERINKISEEISSLINNPEENPKNYENWLKLTKHLDTRLNNVLIERNRIREESDKRRRRWMLIAALIGGITTNYDNLYNLIKGHSAIQHSVLPSKKLPENLMNSEPSPEITYSTPKSGIESETSPSIYKKPETIYSADKDIEKTFDIIHKEIDKIGNMIKEIDKTVKTEKFFNPELEKSPSIYKPETSFSPEKLEKVMDEIAKSETAPSVYEPGTSFSSGADLKLEKFVDAISQKVKAGGFSVPVGRGGFWEAAKNLQNQLGISKKDFDYAWNNAKITDPISGKVLNLREAHWVHSSDPKRIASLVYNPTKKVFEAIVAPKVNIGDADKLLEAYSKLGKKVPLSVLKSISKLP